jgi:glycosyltransferase involved in cell wall biosynthesis
MGISVSNSARNSLWGPIRKKTYIIYNCIDNRSISEAARRVIKEENSPAADVICIGRLVPLKKQDILIKALGILASNGIRLKTLFVGGGNENTNSYYLKLKELISTLKLDNDVTFAGHITAPYGMLAKAKVSVVCCTIEGYGLVVPESMICRVPVIVPDAGGAGELVQDGITGLKFIADDALSLADTLKKVLQNGKLVYNLVDNAYTNALGNFTIESYMQQLKERFCEVLSR